MAQPDSWEVARNKRAAMNAAEKDGRVADSMEVRRQLMLRVHSGEITLADAQAELAQIKRGASARGMTTRAGAFRDG